jgi:hypothetical protein
MTVCRDASFAPLVMTGAAWLIGVTVFLIARSHDGCTSYAFKPVLVFALVAAGATQGAALLGSVVSCVRRRHGGVASLLIVAMTTCVAVPAALCALLELYGIFCGDWQVLL